MEELEQNVIQWARKRGLLIKGNQRNQLLKAFEEMGEISSAELKGDYLRICDGIGDVLVCLIIYAKQHETTIGECLGIAYGEIKDRKGKTINGTFIKNE